jgi:hypothetical protein
MENGPKLLALIAPNKNGHSSYKNLNAMIRATTLKFPKYATEVITFAKTRPIQPLEMGKKTCQ